MIINTKHLKSDFEKAYFIKNNIQGRKTYLKFLTICILEPVNMYLANSEDIDNRLQGAAFHQGLCQFIRLCTVC